MQADPVPCAATDAQLRTNQLTIVARGDEPTMKEKATALLGQLHGLFDQHAKELEEAKTDLAKRTESFQQEQELMQTKPVADNDIVEINVGGTLLSTKRSTLTQAEGSTLAAMFSGRWEQCLDHDAEGRVFLDFDPYCFQRILFCLRAHNICSKPAAAVVLPHMEPSTKAAFNDLVRYLTLEDYLCSCIATTALTIRALKLGEACIFLEGRRAKVLSGNRVIVVIVDPCIQGVAYMKCKLHRIGQRMFVGIGLGLDHADECTYCKPAMYGWTSGSDYQYKVIRGMVNRQLSAKWVSGDWLLLRCDMQSKVLSLLMPSLGTPLHIQFDACDLGQCFHFHLFEVDDEVELLPVSTEEQSMFDVQ